MGINIYQIVTDRILEQLENNIIAWRKSWEGGIPINYVTRKPYNGINLLLLPCGGEWLTYKQAEEAGGSVKKGEKGSMIVFYKLLESDKEQDNKVRKEKIPILKYSNVFHINQCENIKTKITPIEENNINPIEEAENVLTDYINRSGVQFKNIMGSNEAYYSPARDTIIMPNIKQFSISEEYYSTAFHEAAHSTGYKTRLDRIIKDAKFNDNNYSKEELVAEITTCMIMNTVGIELPETFDNSVAYISAWKKRLKDDNKIILTASSQAQKAANMIMGVSN